MLTNTERQQIVEEVNAGTYGIDEALDDIAEAQKGEEVRKALYAEALVLNREGHAGSTDMIARQQIANLQTSVNGQISTFRTEVGEDIDDLETALNSGLATQNGKIAAQDATIANVVKNYNLEYGSETLWEATGETGLLASGTTATLSKDVSNFDYVDIYSFCGNINVLDTVPVDAKLQSTQGYATRWVNLSDPGSGTYQAYVRIVETRLHIIGTTLTIDHQVTYRNGEGVNISGAEITQSNRSTYMGEFGIMKIVGRKITANTEIEDVRIGADGTEYDSAGQAVRAQVTALESAIPAVDSTLSTHGAAADAKVAGDKVAELKSAFDDLESTLIDDGIILQEYNSQKTIAGSTVYSNGVIITGSSGQNTYIFAVPSGETVIVTGGNNYGLFATMPEKDVTVTVDATRHIGALSNTSITMPSGANYLAIVNSAEPSVNATGTPISERVASLETLVGNTPMGTTAATVTGAIAEHEDEISGLDDDVDELKDCFTVNEQINHIILSQNNLWGIPNDMTVTISDGTVTFSYPYESGNKGKFGLLFSNITNGESYTLNFDVTNGGLADVSNIRCVTLTSQGELGTNLLGTCTKDGSHYACTFTAALTESEPDCGLILSMQRSISTTVTLGNITLLETGATAKTVIKNSVIVGLTQENFDDSVNELLNKEKGVEITISNSDKIGYISNSFLNGYCMRGHHAIENISMFDDYIHYNYGKSGDNAVSALKRIEDDSTWLGDVPISQWHMKYAVIAMEDNDRAMFEADYETYYQNFKKLCAAVRALGAIPVLGTEHDVNKAYYALQNLAREQGIMFMNWGKVAHAMICGFFPPFWNNNHPATRTAWFWSNGMKKYLDTLPRPEQSIKLFRVRDSIDTTDIDNLLYNDNVERAERFAEIHVGQSALTKATEKYFDRMGTSGIAWETVKDEYQILQSKSASVSFGSFALIECVTPYDADNLESLSVSLASSGVSGAYIKKNIGVTLPYTAATKIAFGVTTGADLLTAGSQFTITGGTFSDTLLGTYTVDSVVNGIVITTTSSTGKTTSGTDAPICNVTGVTLSGSYVSMSSDYLSNYTLPVGEWVEIDSFNANGRTDLSDYIGDCVDFDKVSILLVGSSLSLADVSFSADGSQKKDREAKGIVEYREGTSILTDTLLNDNTEWDNINSVPKYTPVVSTLNNAVSEGLPSGITTVRILGKGDSISQNLITTGLNTNAYVTNKLQIRVIARYFPKYVDSDTVWATSDITETSYDCARMAITLGDSAAAIREEVGAYWNQYIFDVDYISGTAITITCEEKNLQIAKVECEIV